MKRAAARVGVQAILTLIPPARYNSSVFSAGPAMFPGVKSRPLSTVLGWQVIATAVLALLAAIPWGAHGAASAALGGLVNVTAGWAYGWLVSRKTWRTAGEGLQTMFRAEATKVLLVIVQLGLVYANYREIVVAGFLASFVVTVLVSTTAIAVNDAPGKN
jgi:ATP synthase protein I